MKMNKLIGLTAVAVILGVAAYMSSNSKKVKTPSYVGKPVIPGLDLSKVMKIEFKDPEGEVLKLESGDSGWKISSLYDYPADITKIRKNLLDIKNLEIGSKAPAGKVAAPSVLDLQDSSGKSLATLLMGDEHMRKASGQMAQFGGGSFPDGRYVSAGDSGEAWLVKETLSSFSKDPSNWADTQIISITSSDVNGIALMRESGACILSKKDGNWSIAGLKEDEEFDTSSSYSLESALSSLSFNTLADPALTDEDLGINTGAVFKVTLKNGESYTAKVGNPVADGTDRYMKIAAAFTPQGTNETVNAEIRTKVDNFNTGASKWTYIIPSYKAESMMKERSDLVKQKEKAEEDKEQPAREAEEK
jgi:hypothetical protein